MGETQTQTQTQTDTEKNKKINKQERDGEDGNHQSWD